MKQTKTLITKRQFFSFFLVLLCLAELGLHTFFSCLFGYYGTPVFLFLISILIGIIPLFLFYKNDIQLNISSHQKRNKSVLIVSSVFICLIIFLIFIKGGLLCIYKNFEVSIKYSDIIPTIQTMCTRTLSGIPIYTNIENFGYYLPTTYLPFMWLPYLFAEYLKIDYRWMTLFIWCLGVLFFIYKTSTKTLDKNLLSFLFFSSSIGLFYLF